MHSTKRLVVAPAMALALAGLTVTGAEATTDPLPTEGVNALAVASCQLDPSTPLTLEQMSPVVVAEADVDVVPGEISAHVVRAQVLTSAGDVQECTFGVLHRDAQLKQVQHLGTASLARVETLSGTSYAVETAIELGNMGNGSAVDPTTEVNLGGFLTSLEQATEDPTYTVSVNRKSIQTVQIAVNRAQKNAAARLLAAEAKAAAKLLKKQTKAIKAKHARKGAGKKGKRLDAAQKSYTKRIAAARAKYQRAVAPRTVQRPVSVNHTVTGPVSVAG